MQKRKFKVTTDFAHKLPVVSFMKSSQSQGFGVPLGTEQNQQEMDDAHSGLEVGIKPVYHPVSRSDAVTVKKHRLHKIRDTLTVQRLTMEIFFNSLKMRLIVVLVFIALVPGIAASWIAHDLMFENLKAERITDVGLVADAQREQLVKMLTRQNTQAKAFLANLSSQCGGTTGKVNVVCARNLLQSDLAAENALGIRLRSKTGDILNVGQPSVRSTEDPPFSAGQLASFTGVGTELNRSYFIAANDEKSGYHLTVTYPSSLLESLFSPYPADLGSSGETFLADGDGHFVTSPKYASTQGYSRPISARPMQACLSGRSTEMLDKDYRDADIIHGFRFIPEFGAACIMAHITQEEAFAPLRALEQRLLAALALCALLLAIAAIYLAKRIVSPLNKLTAATRNIASGNHQEQADETGFDEFAELAVSFNTMTRKLRASSKLLEAVVEHIPVMVSVKRASDLRIELFNRAGTALTGYSKERVIGKGNYDLWPKEQGDFLTAADRKVLAAHEVTEIPEEPITCTNGEIRYLQTWKVAIRDERDEPTHLLGISVDITERKKIEQELRNKEAQLSFALRASHTGGWDIDLRDFSEHRTIEHDRIFGYDTPLARWTYEFFLGHVLPEDRAEVDRKCMAAAKAQSNWDFECRIRRSDGAVRWIWATGEHQFDETGQAWSMAGIVQDITERKLVEQEIISLNAELEQRVAARTAELEQALGTLRASETNLSVTLNSIGEAVLSTDIEGRVTRLNAAAEKYTGWSQAEALGRPLNDVFHIIHRQTRQPAINPVQATLAQGITQGLANNTVLIARDGSEHPIADSCAPIRNREGDVIGAVLVFRDVANEYAAQAALRDSAARIQAVVNTVADGIITIDQRGIIETFNPAAERLFGFSVAEAVGQNVSMLMPEPYHHQHDGYLERYCATGEARVIGIGREVTGRRKDGSTFPMYLAVSEMRLDGERRFTGIVHDLTESKRAEQNLVVAKEAAELASRAKSSFLATMSHEIRTPLTGMLGMLEVLSLTPLDQDQEATLKTVWDSSRSLLRIVNDILDWSKLEEGKLEISLRATALPQLLQEITNTYSRVASSNSLVLSQSCDARLSPAHIVDPLRLSQVLNNFVSNALKFTERGTVELRAELLERSESGERIRFSVKDSGIGIAPEVQQQLFQRYQQESADTARMYGGTGLGLSICRRLVGMMDGQIELESELGKGSTFSVILTLPVSALPGTVNLLSSLTVEHKKISPLFADGAQAPLVLAVDDHPINRGLLSRQIKLLGLHAETAESGRGALALWRSGRFALVITDCHMPEMDGYALTKAIREIERTEKRARTPVIAWTANALAEEETLCKAAGMDELLVKPADLSQLKKMLAKWLSIADSASMPDAAEHLVQSGQQASPIDFAALSEIVSDRAEQIQVLHNFHTHIRNDFVKLAAMLELGERANLERIAHRIKGSCRMVGAKALADACACIEQAARSGNMDEARAGRAGLDAAYTQLDTYLIELFSTQGDNNEGE